MTFKGINFRANATNSAGGPADGANDTYWASGSGDVYPVTRNGLTFGASNSFQWDGRDRTNSSEPRLNGIGFPSGTYTFRVDLPSGAGTYDIRVALGDFSAARASQSLTIADGAGSTLATISGSTTAANNFLDASGVERTAANWPGSNVTIQRTFTNSYALLTATSATFLAHFALQANTSLLSGSFTLDDFTFTGSFATAPSSSLSGGFTLDDFSLSGTMGLAPGVIHSPPFKNWTGTLLPGVTVPRVVFLRLSDMATVLTLTNQTTDGAGVMNITDAALVTGTQYVMVCANSDGSSLGAELVTAV